MKIPWPVLILAGGLATRLRLVTATLPKALVPIHGVPFVHYQLDLLIRQGITKAVFCVGYLGEQIEQEVTAARPSIKVEFRYDGPNLLGTAGAIRNLYKELPDTFFVLYGDSYVLAPFAPIYQYFQTCSKPALMTVYKNRHAKDNSNVVFCEKEIVVYDKKKTRSDMEHIDYGLGVFRKEAFAPLQEGVFCDLADLYQTLLSQHKLAGYEVHEPFYEVGSFAGIEDLSTYSILRRLL